MLIKYLERNSFTNNLIERERQRGKKVFYKLFTFQKEDSNCITKREKGR